MSLDFTHEAETLLEFHNDFQFSHFRAEIADKYDSRMVKVSRRKVRRDGSVQAKVNHASNLGAEIKGRAYILRGEA